MSIKEIMKQEGFKTVRDSYFLRNTLTPLFTHKPGRDAEIYYDQKDRLFVITVPYFGYRPSRKSWKGLRLAALAPTLREAGYIDSANYIDSME